MIAEVDAFGGSACHQSSPLCHGGKFYNLLKNLRSTAWRYNTAEKDRRRRFPLRGAWIFSD